VFHAAGVAATQSAQAASASKGARPPRPPDGDRSRVPFAQIQILRRLYSATLPRRTTLMESECKVPIKSERDIVVARQKGRTLARDFGFSLGDATLIATAISELARNIITYAKEGMITMNVISTSTHEGLLIVASDEGPGIADIPRALRDGFTTSGSLGIGLPGVRRLMDEFDVSSQPGQGTIVTVTKWKF
jgi:serine/threonine-protein kinase RsbT